ncbi:MAG: hypothetical protein JO033_04715 [Acidobacteriaceae bacterium]|nr:hypothetical protein [Acidobacteriaceae bacterium]MBV9499015.1 hypothetical protein [Acidobacteriaceae bacterium]
MNKAVLTLLLFAAVVVADSPGIRPRADAQSYPAHYEQPDYSIGAVLIPPEQAKKMFKLDLNHAGYIVVEVGFFPAPGKDVDLYPTDFTLFVGDKLATLRPVSADTVADLAVGNRPTPAHTSGPHDVNTSAGASVGHVSYPDPVTGHRTSGTVAETDAGVGIGGPAPQPCRGYDCDSTGSVPSISQPSPVQTANTISQDVWEKSLPDGKTAHAVAGYLYFPKPSRKAKDAAWELRYENADGKARLPLPR